MKGSFLLLVLIFAALSPLYTQSTKSDVHGAVVDSTTTPLIGATVVLLQPVDSVMVSFGITNNDGRFFLRDIPVGTYYLQITYLGYGTFQTQLSVPPNVPRVDAGTIALAEENAVLDEVVVKAEHIPIVIKKDTIEYNAAAFETRPDAAVEDLLKKLPGVEVERDGTIRAQGETVENVYVDGKEFFGQDPQIATKNLPADAVDKVQVYDKKSELAEFSGIDDGEREKTINLALKEDHKNGYFGHVEGGYGTKDRYEGRFNINRFGPKTQASALGMVNNINEQGFSINDYIRFMGGLGNMMGNGGRIALDAETLGLPLNFGQNQGITQTLASGINFNYEFSERTDLQSSYFLNRIKNGIELQATSENITPDIGFRTDEMAERENRSWNHNLNVLLRHDIDSTQQLTFRNRFAFRDGLSAKSGLLETRGSSGFLQNQRDRIYDADLSGRSLSSELTYRKRIGRSGRLLTAHARLALGDQDGADHLRSFNHFFIDNPLQTIIDTLRQQQLTDNHSSEYRLRLSYTEPVWQGVYLGLTLTRRTDNNKRQKDFFDVSFDTPPVHRFNAALSDGYERDFLYHTASTSLRINRKKWSGSAGLAFQQADLNGLVISEDLSIDRRFRNILPNVNFRYDFESTRNLSINYSASTLEPSVEQLQPIVNNSDPLLISEGNPNLQPEYRHDLDIDYSSFDRFSLTNWFIRAFFSYTDKRVVYAKEIDESFRQTLRPINTDYAWMAQTYLNFGTPLRFMHSKINIRTEWSYDQSFVWVNDVRDRANRSVIGGTFTLENRKKKRIDALIGFRWNWNTTQYATGDLSDQQFSRHTLFADVRIFPNDHWTLESQFDYIRYSQEAFGQAQSIPLWNVSISTQLLSSNRIRLTLSAQDLLNKNLGIDRVSRVNYLRESRTNVLGRFFMIGLRYTLSGFNGDPFGGIDVDVRRR